MTQPGLTFAPLIRVSTERQEKRGESLNTQRTQLQQAIANMDGKVHQWYQGQEHATPDQERAILTKLMEDAKQKKFNAVIVCDTSRWSRDNGRSKQDLEILKKHGIRFFVREREFGLFDPMSSFMLGMGVEVAEFFAAEQAYKSIINLIARAKKGFPTRPRLPYGRIFDKKTAQWGIDPDKQQKMNRAIVQYLSGGSLKTIAPTLGVSDGQVHNIMTKSLGTDWSVTYAPKRLNINETIPFKIPPLVDDETIRKVKARMEANRTFKHAQLKNQYLLGRMIFCDKCGFALTGAGNHGELYYRHHTLRGCKKAWAVRADKIETAVLDDLYRSFGDAVKSTEAMKNAIPDPWRRQAFEDQIFRCQKDLAKNEHQRDRIIDAIAEGTITKPEAAKKLDQFRQIESTLLKEQSQAEGQLASIPSKEEIGKKAEWMKQLASQYFKSDAHLEEMTFEDKRALLQSLFAGKTEEGKRFGVYISRDEKRFVYSIKGGFGEFIEDLEIQLNLLDEFPMLTIEEMKQNSSIKLDVEDTPRLTVNDIKLNMVYKCLESQILVMPYLPRNDFHRWTH